LIEELRHSYIIEYLTNDSPDLYNTTRPMGMIYQLSSNLHILGYVLVNSITLYFPQMHPIVQCPIHSYKLIEASNAVVAPNIKFPSHFGAVAN